MKKIYKIGERKFPGDEKRKVYADILTWKNYDPDARHYRVRMREEDNPKWTGNGWVISSNDLEYIGENFYKTFKRYKFAEDWCKEIFKENFNSKNYKLIIKLIE